MLLYTQVKIAVFILLFNVSFERIRRGCPLLLVMCIYIYKEKQQRKYNFVKGVRKQRKWQRKSGRLQLGFEPLGIRGKYLPFARWIIKVNSFLKIDLQLWRVVVIPLKTRSLLDIQKLQHMWPITCRMVPGVDAWRTWMSFGSWSLSSCRLRERQQTITKLHEGRGVQ